MSFKSKQRAKHGHLFGDDPLSASLVSTSDDPLFGPKKTTTSSINKSSPSVSNDPLSRLMSNDSNPLETNSTPISNRRKANGNLMTHSQSSSSSSHNGSIFGDIDVSKLGSGNGFSSNIKKVNNSTSLRSSATLKSSKLNLDEEEDLLFGGHRHSPSRSKLAQKSSTTTTSSNSPSLAPSPVLSNASPSPLLSPVNQPSVPSTPKKSPILSSNALPVPAEQVKQENNNIPKKLEQSIPPVNNVEVIKKEETVKKEAKPTVSSSTSSFFKFFKSSSSNQTPKAPSSASSTASINAPSVQNEDVVNTNTNTSTTITNPLPPPRETNVQTNQSKSTIIYKNIKQIITKEKPVEEEEEENTRPEIILDEATRAFAEDDLFTGPKTTTTSQYDFRSLSPEVTMDALTINNDSNKKLNVSISTPTRVDDPWSEIPVSQNFTVEPSMSSPLIVKVQDIEPQKRSAFADLIQSWNTGNTANQDYTVRENDPETFYDHIAEERRDVGFAGIQGPAPTDNQASSMADWAVEEDNPWN